MTRLALCVVCAWILLPLLCAEEEPLKETPAQLELVLPLKDLTRFNQEKVRERFEAHAAIAQATVDLEAKTVKLAFAPEHKVGLAELVKIAKSSGTTVDLGELAFPMRLEVELAGSMNGAVRTGGGFRLREGQRLVREGRGAGIRSLAWRSDKVLDIDVDGEVTYATIATLINQYGSADDGSNQIVDIRWETNLRRKEAEAGKEPKKGRR